MRYINLPNEKKAKLARKHKTSRVTVWSALHYQTKSVLANAIRRDALEMGGVVMETLTAPAGFLPNCTSQFEHDERNHVTKVTQTFANKVVVTLDYKSDSAEIRHNGHLVKHYKSPKLEDWTEITFTAQNLAEELDIKA